MNRLLLILKVLVGLGCIVAAGVLVGWWGTGGAAKPIAQPPAVTTSAEPQTLPPELPNPPVQARPEQPAQPAPKPAPLHVAAAAESETHWQDHLDDILSSQEDPDIKASQMLALLPQLPEEGQIEAVQYASNLLPDTNYSAVGGYLLATNTPEQVRDVLMAGLLQRPDSVKLPYLLAMAQDQSNPQAAQAKQYLSSFMDADYGNNWGQWQARVNQWVRNNSD